MVQSHKDIRSFLDSEKDTLWHSAWVSTTVQNTHQHVPLRCCGSVRNCKFYLRLVLRLKVSVCEKPLEGTSVSQQISIGIKCIDTHFYASVKDVLECLTSNQDILETEGWLKQHNQIGVVRKKELWDFLMQLWRSFCCEIYAGTSSTGPLSQHCNRCSAKCAHISTRLQELGQ